LLIYDILDRALRQRLYGSREAPGAHAIIEGGEAINKVIPINQGACGTYSVHESGFVINRGCFLAECTPEPGGAGGGFVYQVVFERDAENSSTKLP
jgi:hypothetical protein